MTTHLTEVGPRDNPFPADVLERMIAVLGAELPGFDEAAVRAVFAAPGTLYHCTLTMDVPEDEAEARAAHLTAALQAAGLSHASVHASWRMEWVDKAKGRDRVRGAFQGIILEYENFQREA